MILLEVFVVLLHLVSSVSLKQSVVYVKPSDSHEVPFGQTVLTLQQYADRYFASGTTLLFLPGNHTVHTTIKLKNISDVVFAGEDANVTIFCRTEKTAFYVENVTNLVLKSVTFSLMSLRADQTSSEKTPSVIEILNSSSFFTKLTFLGIFGSKKALMRAVHFNHSNATVDKCHFERHAGDHGGALYITEKSNIILRENYFVENRALHSGGAVFANKNSILALEGNIFASNSALYKGGALSCLESKVEVTSMMVKSSNVSDHNYNNTEALGGTEFIANNANYGGALYLRNSKLISVSINERGEVEHESEYKSLNDTSMKFTDNFAARAGGGMHCEHRNCSLASLSFVNNSASLGGSLLINQSRATFINATFTENRGVAMMIYGSNISFRGNTIINGNVGAKKMEGGAIQAEVSLLSFDGHTKFEANVATTGGGALSGIVKSQISFSGVTVFSKNIAKTNIGGGGALHGKVETKFVMSGSVLFTNNICTGGYGGAISLLSSNITFSDNITFEFNSAQMGGAIYLRDAIVILRPYTILNASHNRADLYGGAILHEDNINYFQCNFLMESENGCDGDPADLYSLPQCFLRLEGLKLDNKTTPPYKIISINNYAAIDGQFLYGGLMDKCRVMDTSEETVKSCLLYTVLDDHDIIDTDHQSSNSTDNAISSEAYTLCFCEDEDNYECNISTSRSAYRGSRFNVSLLALSQSSIVTAQTILAKFTESARLKLNQEAQNIPNNCTSVSYNMYSIEEQAMLTLYPNKSCRDTGLATAVVYVVFKPCPSAFSLSGDKCVCEERLQRYTTDCVITDDQNYIVRKSGSKFWVSGSYSNNSYEGLILYKSCPADYCKITEINFSLSQPDSQCDFNHSGVLCGACANTYSLMLGNSKCQRCSNLYLYLLAAFAVAGIALIVFLSVLRLTVATGMINSVILYANIIQANKTFFFPNDFNPLTVFIAWMNLDLGITTCFYDGMDAYAQTWLQFAFPIYVWVLISVIIIISRYSTAMTKLIGSNPIAVLATLLLMSYAKLLKNLIEIYSSVYLDYPLDRKVTVWLKDANVPYLKSKHLYLAVVGSLFIAFFFLPYTLLLLLGYKLYRFPIFRWFMLRMKPLLDSYYAPYEKHTRYWTGLLLVVRCGLYIVFSMDSIGGTNHSLLAIIAAFTAILVIAWLSIRIYKDFYVNVLEAVVYLNLIILAASTANNVSSKVVVDLLVGIVFAIMMGIVVYHFHLLYIAKSPAWLKTVAKAKKFMKYITKKNPASEPAAVSERTLPPYQQVPTESFLDLREPLVDDEYDD